MPAAKFRQQGVSFELVDPSAFTVLDRLPGGVFIVKKHPKEGYLYLERIESFVMPPKLYGSIEADAKRVLHTFDDRPYTTGVLLLGDKGSGKTQLVKLVSAIAEGRDVPTIVINTLFKEQDADKLNQLIQEIGQPAIVVLDEFEKLYVDEEGNDFQHLVLTLLDGVFPSKKLFMLTCNDRGKINNNMKNRPGRIFYAKNYVGMTDEEIIEYARDNLKESLQKEIPAIQNISKYFASFNFDMVKAIVEEMNRYDESANKAVRMLNVQPAADEGVYGIEIKARTGRETGVSIKQLNNRHLHGHPLGHDEIDIEGRLENGNWFEETFTRSDLKGFDAKSGIYTYETPKYTMVLARAGSQKYHDIEFE